MNIRTLFNLALLIVAIILGLVMFYEPGLAPPEPEHPPLTSIAPEAIQTIRRIQENREELQLERQEDTWLVTAPIQAPANPATIGAILSLATTPSYSQYPLEDIELSRVGLEPPEAHLYLNDVVIAFGGTEPLNQRRYVLLEDAIHLIDDTAFYTLASNAASFVDTALLPGDKAIVRLQFPQVTGSIGNPKVRPKHLLTVRREEDGWRAEGFEDEPDQNTLSKLIQAWQQTSAEQVELKGDGATLTTIEVQREGEPPLHFELLATLPRLVLARPDFGVQYRFPASAWKTLFQLVEN
jgi:hypothetical protein